MTTIINKKKKYFIIYNIIILMLFLVTLFFPNAVIKESSIKIKNKGVLEPFANTNIKQEFISSKNASTFAVQFGTYGYIFKNGLITVTVTDLQSNKKCTSNILATSLSDTGPSVIKCNLKKKNKYLLEIKTKNIPDEHKITLYTTDYNSKNFKLKVDGEESNKNLVLFYYNKANSYINIFYVILLLTIDMIIYPFIFNCDKSMGVVVDDKKEKNN